VLCWVVGPVMRAVRITETVWWLCGPSLVWMGAMGSYRASGCTVLGRGAGSWDECSCKRMQAVQLKSRPRSFWLFWVHFSSLT
jgi:hypothetical protein